MSSGNNCPTAFLWPAFSSSCRRDYIRSTASRSCGGWRARILRGQADSGSAGRRQRGLDRDPTRDTKALSAGRQEFLSAGRQAQDAAIGVIRKQPQGAIGSLPHVADALAQIRQQCLLADHVLILEHKAVQRLAGEGANEQVAPPFREELPRVERRTRGSNRGVPIIDRLFHASLMRALADPRVIIVATVGDDRPAVIVAGVRDVDLIAAA